jgi:DNA-binding response OmpR family regulator
MTPTADIFDMRRTILVIEEDRELARDIRAVVEPAARVECAHGTIEAAAALLRRVPDLLLIDLDLAPYFSPSGAQEGLSFLEVVRDFAGFGLPVVVFGSDLDGDTRLRLSAFRVAACMSKPPDLAAVLAIVGESRPRGGSHRTGRAPHGVS